MLDFRLLKNGGSAGESFGDSYALGMAGTGGTSSSSLFPAELWTFLGLGVGSREDEGGCCGIRGCRDPVEVRDVLWLALDPTERPELYDFRLISGVVREDDGVETFLGNIEGDSEEVRLVGISSCGGVFGIGGAFCRTDNLFALRASVGLTVLAPNPVA